MQNASLVSLWRPHISARLSLRDSSLAKYGVAEAKPTGMIPSGHRAVILLNFAIPQDALSFIDHHFAHRLSTLAMEIHTVGLPAFGRRALSKDIRCVLFDASRTIGMGAGAAP